jgi:DNA-binding transcriptional MerR regulator
MRNATQNPRQWRIGELAAITGATVRALHHYEQTGLLASPERSEGGHRIYGAAGVERIYRIRALRELGLSLDQIRLAIDGGTSLGDLLRAHLARVEEKIAQLALLRDRLSSLTSRPDAPVGVDDLLATLEAMSRVERHIEERRRELPETGEKTEEAWRHLGQRLRACLEAGLEVRAAEAQALAREARTLIHRFAGGEAQLVEDLARLRATSPPRDLAGWTPELMRYLDAALAALPAEEERC